MIALYDYELSGNCYKLRLLLSFLKIEYKTQPGQVLSGAGHKSGVVSADQSPQSAAGDR